MAVAVSSTLILLDPADVTTNYVAHNISGVMGALAASNRASIVRCRINKTGIIDWVIFNKDN